MNSAVAPIPPLPKIAAALRHVTERLAREFVFPTDEAPAWGDFEWRIARAVASMQGISSLLSGGLRWSGPADWRRFLAEQKDHTAGRHRKIAQLIDRIDAEARREGVALVALKGAALHDWGIYQAGERPMADVDLLARDVDAQAAARVLEYCGFDNVFTTWRHQVFEPRIKGASTGFGEHVDNPIKIELHTSILDRLPISEIDITSFVFPRTPHAGLNDYPSAASLMMHLLLHAAGNIRASALRCVQLNDIARLAVRFAAGDWEELLAARPNGHTCWWATPPLLLTMRYFPGAIPQKVVSRLGLECPWLLGKRAPRLRLTDVSWSNIRAQALPGIEWSRTPQEALSFLLARIWPGRESRWELKHFAAHHPGASEVPWYGISQGARIVRWVFSTPPRVQTLLSVRAALAERRDEPERDAVL